MIIIDMRDQLGNQMFEYASAKSISLDLNYSFGFLITPTKLINSIDIRYGNTIENIFKIDLSERLESIPNFITNYYNEQYPRFKTNYLPTVYNISDNTLLKGHFQCPKYFNHRKEQVKKWFQFNEIFLKRMKPYMENIRNKKNTKLVSLHMRLGKDYQKQGRVLDSLYYKKAIQMIENQITGKMCIMLFSDVPDQAINILNTLEIKHDIEINNGTLFEDLFLMTQCDAHIVSNSTLAWWGAYLSDNSSIVIRPSVYPIAFRKFYPIDIFPDNWNAVEASRKPVSILSITLEILSYIKKLAKIIKNFLH